MSRSLRKTPIFGHTTARSEAHDKRQGHKRLRAGERGQLASVGPETDHVTVDRNAVSSTWDMAKDGKYWFGPSRQREVAERKALQARVLAKWRSK